MRILYFGWVRTNIGLGEEEISLPPHVENVADLIGFLRDQGDGYRTAFENIRTIRVAVDQEMAGMETLLSGSKEVALFPPMTGG
ncbi:MAG: molybdopterin converting factor subunit 1 [Pseudomonadota bacterium]|nr:molybdopterin converting factor subunit 1 [Pseudomonadota bacterium]